jgi:arsenate reductase
MARYNVLFLCTRNSARSIFAEVLLNYWGKGRFHAYSAGSEPSGEIHPLTIQLLERNYLATGRLRSKSWAEFALDGAPRFDFVFTVCDGPRRRCCAGR